jgi:hypothetical protein
MGDTQRAGQQPNRVLVVLADRAEQVGRGGARVTAGEVGDHHLQHVQGACADRGGVEGAGQQPRLGPGRQVGRLCGILEQLTLR